MTIPSSADLDTADPLAPFRERFVPSPGLVAYLDGNSLGRPLIASAEAIDRLVREQWAGRLIRGWDEGWLELPLRLGDELGRVALGAAPGQTAFGDSTTVLIYKQVRAALALRPGRDELIVSRDDFPTDRYVLEGIAAEAGATLHWLEPGDVTPDAVAAAASKRTAVVVLSAIAYRSGFAAEVERITEVVHDAGAVVVWDLCHAAGVWPLELDAWGVDLAVGCSYKYLNGGPGAPAFAYVASALQPEYRQPIQGWIGSATPFEMGQGYEPAAGIRRVLSGTPPIVGLASLGPALAALDEAGLDAVRAKSVALTEHAVTLADSLLPSATLSTTRDPARRGSHVTLDHPDFERIMPRLWERGVIPDFRRPSGIRLGLSPLSTSFAELEAAVQAIAEELG